MKDERSIPHKRAIALRYDQEHSAAPKLVAKGERLMAEKIIALARENGVHVHEDPDLTAILSKLDVNTEIPEDLYQAVAEVLAFIYQLNKKLS